MAEFKLIFRKKQAITSIIQIPISPKKEPMIEVALLYTDRPHKEQDHTYTADAAVLSHLA